MDNSPSLRAEVQDLQEDLRTELLVAERAAGQRAEARVSELVAAVMVEEVATPGLQDL
jgi:hypothetical protein